jgi:hypothetical protein
LGEDKKTASSRPGANLVRPQHFIYPGFVLT